MLLADLIASKVVVAPIAGTAAVGSYQVGAGAALADGVVGFTIDGLDISSIPGVTAGPPSIGAELADILNGAPGANHTAVDDGAGLVTLTDKRLGVIGNSVVITDVTTDAGILAGTVTAPIGGVDAAAGSSYVAIDDGVNPIINITEHTIRTNASVLRKILRDNGYHHDLQTEKQSTKLDHALAIRILEQL